MPVFISHSHENKPEYDNIADALELQGIGYWKPESLKAGASLSEQLRAAIVESEVCVFVATRDSVASNWCGAELGAFWGAGKPVVIWVAEASLSESELPRQFQGQLFERRISRVIASLKPHLEAHPEPAKNNSESALVAAMSRAELVSLLADTLERVQDVTFVGTTLSRVVDQFSRVDATVALGTEEQRQFRELLSSLIGVSDLRMQQGAKNAKFGAILSFETETGQWSGGSGPYESHPDSRAPIGYYKNCIAWRSGEGQRVETVALLPTIVDHDEHGIVDIREPLLVVGRGQVGKVKDTWSRPFSPSA